MKIEIIRQVFTFVILCIVQVLVLNHINLFGCATPLLYVYFVMSFRRGYPRWAIMLWSFCLGLCIDVFSDTPGVAASSATFLGFVFNWLQWAKNIGGSTVLTVLLILVVENARKG